MLHEINGCRWIYLLELGEPLENALRIVIEEAKAEGPLESIKGPSGTLVCDVRPIESDTSCKAFELVWATYVSYCVRNESFCSIDEEEEWEGRLFCLYSKSHFLDYVTKATFASADYPGPFRHWGINCLNHIVDVVSISDPQIRRIAPPTTRLPTKVHNFNRSESKQ